MKRTIWSFLATGVLFATAACNVSSVSGIGGGGMGAGTGSGTGGGSTPEVACDPLAGKPITLGDVVGVGKDAVGTLYVDAANGVFVSAGGKLQRQVVLGSGSSGTNEFVFDFAPPADPTSGQRNLLVETTGATADAMALGPPGSKAFLNQSPPGITMLALVDPSTLSGLPIVNTPNVIEFVADAANGDVLMATNPLNEDTTAVGGGLAIFYGPPAAVAQRTVTSLDRTLSGGGTMTFLVDGTAYVLSFSSVFGADAGSTFMLQSLTPQGGAPIGVTLRSPTPTSTPPGLTFTCFP
jgi:hypothetical protein